MANFSSNPTPLENTLISLIFSIQKIWYIEKHSMGLVD